MKKSTKIGIVFVVLSLLVIIIGIVFALLVNKEKTKRENMETIKKAYTTFSVAVVNDYELRQGLKEQLNAFDNETYPGQHESFTATLKEYNTIITTINDNLNILEDKCALGYTDSQTKLFCTTYQELYESVINQYVELTNKYNENVTNYNQESEEDYELFAQINKEFIDFNGDDYFNGKTQE